MQNDIKIDCPVCNLNDTHREIVKRKSVPTLQNTTLRNKAEALGFPSGDLLFQQCENCSFVWNSCFDDDLICYDETYNNDVSSSGYYKAHLNARVDAILAAIPEDIPIHYLEIGCGDGEFLHLLIERANGRIKSATGFDPSYSSKRPLPENVTIYKEYFTRENYDVVREDINVICSRHVIEHISDVSSFAKILSEFVSRQDQYVFIETPTVDWIFENTAFFDFFYEHCSLFNPHSIKRLFGRYGLGGNVELVYGNQYLWAELRPSNPLIMRTAETDIGLELATIYKERSKTLINGWVERLKNRKPNERTGIWGAASKGVTFALIMDQGGEGIDFAIDLNKDKQGCFAPITGVEIQSPKSVGLSKNDTIIVMNPNYYDEIKNMLEKQNVAIKLEKI